MRVIVILILGPSIILAFGKLKIRKGSRTPHAGKCGPTTLLACDSPGLSTFSKNPQN